MCACCAGLGLRGSGQGDQSAHRGSHPQPARRVQVQALGEESRNLVPPPRTHPPACRWDPVRWKKQGDREGGRERAEVDGGDHRGRHRSKESPRASGSNGPKGRTAGERGRREREARPGEEQTGISLPGRRWSILQWVGAGMGRPCSAVTSGAARRWPRSPQLINLPCPGLVEAAGARRTPPPTAAAAEPPPCAPWRSSALLCWAGLPEPASGCWVPSRQWDVSPAFREASGIRLPLSSRRRALNSCTVAPGGAARCAPSRRLRPVDSRPPPSPPPRPSATPPSEAA